MNSTVAFIESPGHGWSERVEAAFEHHIQLTPHCSLTPKGAWLFWLSAAIAPATLAISFALRGFWPIVPFAGLELIALGWALNLSMKRRFIRESIAITPLSITIEYSIGKIPRKTIFARHWTRVKLHSSLHHDPGRLTLESQGRVCEVGRFLSEAERRGLAARLQQLVGNMNESPAL